MSCNRYAVLLILPLLFCIPNITSANEDETPTCENFDNPRFKAYLRECNKGIRFYSTARPLTFTPEFAKKIAGQLRSDNQEDYHTAIHLMFSIGEKMMTFDNKIVAAAMVDKLRLLISKIPKTKKREPLDPSFTPSRYWPESDIASLLYVLSTYRRYDKRVVDFALENLSRQNDSKYFPGYESIAHNCLCLLVIQTEMKPDADWRPAADRLLPLLIDRRTSQEEIEWLSEFFANTRLGDMRYVDAVAKRITFRRPEIDTQVYRSKPFCGRFNNDDLLIRALGRMGPRARKYLPRLRHHLERCELGSVHRLFCLGAIVRLDPHADAELEDFLRMTMKLPSEIYIDNLDFWDFTWNINWSHGSVFNEIMDILQEIGPRGDDVLPLLKIQYNFIRIYRSTLPESKLSVEMFFNIDSSKYENSFIDCGLETVEDRLKKTIIALGGAVPKRLPLYAKPLVESIHRNVKQYGSKFRGIF